MPFLNAVAYGLEGLTSPWPPIVGKGNGTGDRQTRPCADVGALAVGCCAEPVDGAIGAGDGGRVGSGPQFELLVSPFGVCFMSFRQFVLASPLLFLLPLACSGEASVKVDQSSPQALAQSIFAAARAGDLAALQNIAAADADGDSKRVAGVAKAEAAKQDEFRQDSQARAR